MVLGLLKLDHDKQEKWTHNENEYDVVQIFNLKDRFCT